MLSPDKRHPNRKCQQAFSLIELLVTLAVLVILIYLMTSRSSSSVQRARKAACSRNLQHIYQSLLLYANDEVGRFPAVTNALSSEIPLSLLVPQYTSLTRIFICPGSSDKALPEAEKFGGRRISYAYYQGRKPQDEIQAVLLSDEQINTLPKLRGAPLFSGDGKGPGANHHSHGGNLLWVGGRTTEEGTNTSVTLPVGPGIRLLNPSLQ